MLPFSAMPAAYLPIHNPPLVLPASQLTHVAKLEPVEIGGVTIQNVSLHSAGHLREMQLGPGHAST